MDSLADFLADSLATLAFYALANASSLSSAQNTSGIKNAR